MFENPEITRHLVKGRVDEQRRAASKSRLARRGRRAGRSWPRIHRLGGIPRPGRRRRERAAGCLDPASA